MQRGNRIITEILAILSDIPLGYKRFEVGLQLRQAMFLNSVLLNIEAWHGLKEKHINELMKCDEYLLKRITLSHAKSQKNFYSLQLFPQLL